MSKNSKNSSASPLKDSCLEKLHSILDGAASSDEKKEFLERHLEVCLPCYKHYHLEMAIRDLLKEKCWKHEAPSELIESIKVKINQELDGK